MAIEDHFPTMSDAELATLLENVERLASAGTDRQRIEAERLAPLIAAERTARRARAPPKPTKTAKTAKPAAKKAVKV